MLGFEGAWSTECCGYYGYDFSKPILMDNLQCTGNERSLAECAHTGWGGLDDVCSHYNDIGVFCIPKPIEFPGMRIFLVFSRPKGTLVLKIVKMSLSLSSV